MRRIYDIESDVMNYPAPLLKAWEERNYSVLEDSNASNYLKKFLTSKSKKHPGRRVFGEVYIASQIEMKDGWYSSSKWLTSPKWVQVMVWIPPRKPPFFKV